MSKYETIKEAENFEQETAERLCFSSIFSLKDLKANNFGNLLVVDNEEEAKRACKIRLMYDRDSLLSQFPADYMLYHVGYFNTKTGIVETTGIPIPIISLLDISLELEKERKKDIPDIPDFMKGDKKDVCGVEKSSSVECSEDS